MAFPYVAFYDRRTSSSIPRGAERNVSPEECAGLERAAVWSQRQVEQRLLDHFSGHPTKTS